MAVSRYVAIAALSFSAGAACAWLYLSRPQTFEECLLSHVKAGMTNTAVAAMRYACETKYPREENPFDQFDAPRK